MTDKDLDRIDLWLDGKLAPKEATQIQLRMETDANYAAAIRLHVASRLAIRQAGADKQKRDLHQRFEDLDLHALAEQDDSDEISSKPSPQIIPLYKRPWIWGAVAATILLIAAILSFSQDAMADPQTLYTSYMSDPLVSQIRGESERDWQLIVASFQAKDYSQVLQYVSTATQDSFKWGEQGKLFAAISLLNLDKTDQAIMLLSQISSESAFGDQARWYQGLAALKLGKLDDAKQQFEIISQVPTHYKKAEAIAILDQLQEMESNSQR